MKFLYFFFFATTLISCGHQGNFSKQKFTNLKQIPNQTSEHESDKEVINETENIASVFELQEIEEEELELGELDCYETEYNALQTADIELAPSIEENEIQTDSTLQTNTEKEDDWLSTDPEAESARNMFLLSLICLAGLIGGILLLFTSIYVAGSILMFVSFVIGYSLLVSSRKKGMSAKRRTKAKGKLWGGGDKIIQGWVIAGLIGFGIGALPLALMAVVGLFGWYD